MNHHDDNRNQAFLEGAPRLFAGGAAFLVVACVAGAHFLSKALERGDISVSTVIGAETMNKLARSAPTGGGLGAAPGARKGVDPSATAALPMHGSAPACADGQPVLVMRSVGIDGVRNMPIAPDSSQKPCDPRR